MTAPQNPRVTLADREAAAAYMAHFRPAGWQNAVAQIPQGNADLGESVQAFARHREAAEAASRAEVERLREELRKAQQPHWFYYGEDCSSDRCRDSIIECIDEDFAWENKPEGDHVLLISGARPVPDMWVALHYYTEAEKDARDSDDEYDYTVHATEKEARAALTPKEPDA